VVHRAQTRLKVDRERPVPAESHRRLVTAFQTAADTGDLEDLTQMLAPAGRRTLAARAVVSPSIVSPGCRICRTRVRAGGEPNSFDARGTRWPAAPSSG
jgi:hypothetical protein